MVDLKQLNGGPPDRGAADESWSIPAKMLHPPVAAGIEERRDRVGSTVLCESLSNSSARS